MYLVGCATFPAKKVNRNDRRLYLRLKLLTGRDPCLFSHANDHKTQNTLCTGIKLTTVIFIDPAGLL